MEIIKGNKNNVSKIITALQNGAVLVLPTDTVYGLICDAENEEAVKKIFEIKKRDKSKPLGVFVKEIEAAKEMAFVESRHEKFLKDNKNTVILKAKNSSLPKLVYKDKTIGIRIPKYELLNLILEKFGKPIAQTSANISGEPATVKIADILEQFKNQDITIVDAGNLSENKSSTIIDLTNNKINILRP
ncbi:MAG: L-threonylcarbamoyladenylate synthase [Candidatus Staskawiczbacteria bacterium]|nr:L-threonylcarbamoyladenylate synthase [Candidatus Staskawiczbacteria bacterium]